MAKNYPKISTGLYSAVDITTRLRAGGSGVRIPVGVNRFLLSKNVQTGSEAHPVNYLMGTGIVYWG